MASPNHRSRVLVLLRMAHDQASLDLTADQAEQATLLELADGCTTISVTYEPA
ncbi:hypothetical protein [Streptomyces sp. UH6]|uniref:hypothetical protein n=1 Tax=Streptomyces sp. UH6 TaxID=2748379 RepID=UPI0015D49AEF|nr:hypothetical protein [Streptomyces sp. UH6]NYV73223.1 hypothetical protein [Streptomyces sp. UH6]